MSSNNKNSRVVYSTNPGFRFEEESEKVETWPPDRQKLYVSLDKKQRRGKKVTVVEGFVGDADDLKMLGKKLKGACGTGGSVKDGVILIQGDFRLKVVQILQNDGYRVKQKGG